MSVSAEPEAAKRRLAFQKSYSVEHGMSWTKSSLIEDAKFDTITNVEFKKAERSSQSHVEEDAEETEIGGDVFPVSNGESAHGVSRHWSVIFTVADTLNLSRIFKHLENNSVCIQHMETRRVHGRQFEILVQFELQHGNAHALVKSLRQHSGVQDVKLCNQNESNEDTSIWIPLYITDLDKCQHLLTKFDPDLDQCHPGFSDKEYRKRRNKIAEIAFNYKQGLPIPTVVYNNEEIQTWAVVYRSLKNLYPTHACQEHIHTLQILERECGYGEYNIPQLEDVTNFLKKKSGFQVRPVAGLLSARDFLSSLAFRVFQCTQYVRHSSSPDHTVEPDCVHELLGHVPMLANPGFAQFSQEIGIASIGASDRDIEKLATIYWFTVEFGLCKENNEIRAYGAALLSAYGELKYALSDVPERKKFEPYSTSLQEYDDQNYQKVYFVCDSFDDMKERVRRYAANITKPYEVRYDPYTQSLQILNNKEVIQDMTRLLQGEINTLTNVLNRIENIVVC